MNLCVQVFLRVGPGSTHTALDRKRKQLLQLLGKLDKAETTTTADADKAAVAAALSGDQAPILLVLDDLREDEQVRISLKTLLRAVRSFYAHIVVHVQLVCDGMHEEAA